MALKILIVDDSEFMRNLIKNIIIKEGIKGVYEAADGIEAVKKYKENKPDLVFMDIMMPNKSGLEAIKEIKNQDPTAKIIIITSLREQKAYDETENLGVNGYIVKPFIKDEIIKAIKENS